MVSVQDQFVLITVTSGIGVVCSSGCKTDFGGSTAGAIRNQIADELSKLAPVHLLQLDVCDRLCRVSTLHPTGLVI